MISPCAMSYFARVDPLPTLEDVQNRLMREAMMRAKGDLQKAAKLIGMTKTTFYRLCPRRPGEVIGDAKVPAPAAMGAVGAAGPELPDTAQERTDGAG